MSDPTTGHGPHEPKPKLTAPPRRVTASRGGGSAGHPHFSQPVRQILLMLTVLVLVLLGGWFAYGRILPIFMANRWLNGLIFAVFALGVLACFWQVAQLIRSVHWIERFAARRRNAVEKGLAARGADDGDQPPRLLAPLASLLGARGPAGGVISTGSARSILESVATRIEEIRDITKYIANLLIFLGLLGTFYGLATTVPAVIETIRALAPQEGETGVQVFDKLMSGLEAQLGGMATAFSSSLLGLAGSLVVGLLELFVTHGQNRFYRELEEWMSGFTRISLTMDGDEAGSSAGAGLLDQIATQIDWLQQFHAERDVVRDEAAAMADERVLAMVEAVEALVRRDDAAGEATIAQAAALTSAMNRMADGQDRLIALMQQQEPPAGGNGLDSALSRFAGQLNESRDARVAELRSDLLVLTRAVRAARFGDRFPDNQLPDPSVPQQQRDE
ncbi:hypothetical protein [Paracoccus alkanivorans]|uniref:hypothetical protein n=1 Tax=Paracoccus alkanivorans TaxID=2116655 RepID=UPI00267DEB72